MDYAFHEFEVFELPELDFFVEPVLVMLPDEPVKTFNLSKYGARYQWDFGDGATYEAKDTIHQYREVGVYDVSLTAWTVHGCQAYMIIPEAVTVIGEGSIMYPNVFRPSTTGPTYGAYNSSQHLNEIFYPVYEGVVEYEFTVYNRCGRAPPGLPARRGSADTPPAWAAGRCPAALVGQASCSRDVPLPVR